MSCERFREALSARLDGEVPDLPDEELDAHLATCPSCRSMVDGAARLRRRAVLYDTDDVPDLSRGIVRQVAAEDRRRSVPIARWLLALIAVEIVVLSIPDFLSGSADAHSLRHLGAFSLAYAVGLLIVVWRPARARTMLAVAYVLVAALVATAIIDVAAGRVPLLGEAVHLLEVASAVLLWILAREGHNDGNGRVTPVSR